MAPVLKLRAMRKRQSVQLPEAFVRVRDIFGMGAHGPFTQLELHRTGTKSYVMAVAGRLCLNVSIGYQFANREEARRWARAYAESHGLAPEPCTKPRRAPNAAREGVSIDAEPPLNTPEIHKEEGL